MDTPFSPGDVQGLAKDFFIRGVSMGDVGFRHSTQSITVPQLLNRRDDPYRCKLKNESSQRRCYRSRQQTVIGTDEK